MVCFQYSIARHGPNVAGVIGTAVIAGYYIATLAK